MTNINLSSRELATVLAALRYWQRAGVMSCWYEKEIATNGGEFDEMTATQIDDLCERINKAETLAPAGWTHAG